MEQPTTAEQSVLSSPLDALIAAAKSDHAQLSEISEKLEAVVTERDAAIEQAALPFIEPIQSLTREHAAFVAKVDARALAARIRQTPMDSLSAVALDILLATKHKSVDEFAASLSAHVTGEDHLQATAAEKIIREFAAFSAFKNELPDGSIEPPRVVGAVAIWLMEVFDAQADWEGSPPGTGEYKLAVNALIGRVTLESLKVIDKDVSEGQGLVPANLPDRLVLGLGQPARISTEHNWGEVVTSFSRQGREKDITILSRDVMGRFDSSVVPPISWIDTYSHLAGEQRTMPASKVKKSSVLLWGDRLDTVLESIAASPETTSSAREAIAQAQQEIRSQDGSRA